MKLDTQLHMRSSKSRSRSKSNRPRSIGNIVNRVFDSSGPEGKVRGTPQQIIDKYLILARDAQLSNDRVAMENFLQHAEHYTRMLGEAQRELQREADSRRDQQQDGFRGDRGGNGNGNGNGYGRDRDEQSEPPAQTYEPASADSDDNTAEVIDLNGDEGSGLVETPESESYSTARRPAPAEEAAAPEEPAAAEDAAQPRERRPRRRSPGPRKPKAAAGDEAPSGNAPEATSAE